MDCNKNLHKHILLSGLSISLLIGILLPGYIANGQSSRYWTHNFNEESSILGGAVIGGGAGPSAIYYNPANISNVENSSFSFNVSLFSINSYKLQNALGNNIDLKKTTFTVQPRFISLIIRPKKNKNLSFEIASLNRESQDIEFTGGEERLIDILKTVPGEERYFATYRYKNKYSDNYVGIGGAYQVSKAISIGATMFVSIKTLNYCQITDIDAFPLSDTIYTDNEPIPFYSASAINNEYVKFTDFRLLWKLGLTYTINILSLGLNFTSPSVSIFSDGRYVSGKLSQSNITNPDGEEFLPNIAIIDGLDVREFEVNYKDPFSISAGLKYDSPNGKRSFFISASFYSGIKPYKIVNSPVNPFITTEELFNSLENKEWLSYAYGADPVFNIGIGYRWKISDNFTLLTGFKTDFNYIQDFDYKELDSFKKFKQVINDVYYISAGGKVSIKWVNLFAGFQYAYGNSKDQPQIINLSDPVEFNVTENAPLQGNRENNMQIRYNSVIFLFGATFQLQKPDKN
jgi:hypothetical protein